MIIFLEEIILQIFLWVLKILDGIMELFSGLTGLTSINYQGENVDLIEFLVGGSTVSRVLWCVFILAIGLSCIFAIIALVKNMIANNRNISTIVGKFFLALLGTMAMLVVVLLGILISNAILQLIARIFDIDTSQKLSETIFNACVGDWLNDYSSLEIDFSTVSVREIFGDYDVVTVFEVFPMNWKMNGMVNPNTFRFIPALITSIVILVALFTSLIKLAKRIYELIFMYVTMPIFLSTLPLDDGARFKSWRETFVSKVIMTHGTVFSISIFALLSPIIGRMTIPGLSELGNSLFSLVMVMGGILIIPTGQMLFSRLLGNITDEYMGKGRMLTVKDVKRVLQSNVTVVQTASSNKGYSYPLYSHKYSGDLPSETEDFQGGYDE